jgi:hypothetical protein
MTGKGLAITERAVAPVKPQVLFTETLMLPLLATVTEIVLVVEEPDQPEGKDQL